MLLFEMSASGFLKSVIEKLNEPSEVSLESIPAPVFIEECLTFTNIIEGDLVGKLVLFRVGQEEETVILAKRRGYSSDLVQLVRSSVVGYTRSVGARVGLQWAPCALLSPPWSTGDVVLPWAGVDVMPTLCWARPPVGLRNPLSTAGL